MVLWSRSEIDPLPDLSHWFIRTGESTNNHLFLGAITHITSQASAWWRKTCLLHRRWIVQSPAKGGSFNKVWRHPTTQRFPHQKLDHQRQPSLWRVQPTPQTWTGFPQMIPLWFGWPWQSCISSRGINASLATALEPPNPILSKGTLRWSKWHGNTIWALVNGHCLLQTFGGSPYCKSGFVYCLWR